MQSIVLLQCITTPHSESPPGVRSIEVNSLLADTREKKIWTEETENIITEINIDNNIRFMIINEN